MDRSRFRGPTPEKSIKTSNIRIPEKDLKKIIVKIKHNKPNTDSQIDEIDHGLDRPEEIKIYRCQGEGSRPIFSREDIRVNNEDVAEKPSENPRRRRRTTSSDSQSHRDYSNSRESPRRSRDNSRRSRDRERYKDRSNSREREHLRRNRHSPNCSRANTDKASNSRRNRSRSKDSRRSRRTRSRSRSKSSRREFGRRRNSRSRSRSRSRSTNRHHRYDRQDYRHSDRRDRRHRRSRSPPRYDRHHPTHVAPLDPAAIGAYPLIIPPELSFYGPDDAIWFQAPIRGPSPVMLPRGFIPPRGMYRAPMYGMRPPLPPRLPPYLYPQRPPQFNDMRGSLNRPRLP